MGVAKSDFLRCVGADLDLIENVERLARIDLDLSDFEKERNNESLFDWSVELWFSSFDLDLTSVLNY